MKGYFGKVLVIIVLCLLSIVPLGMVRGIISERDRSHTNVEHEIARQHGGYQHLTAPLLVAKVVVEETGVATRHDPLTNRITQETRSTEKTLNQVFTPRTTRVHGVLRPQELHRGIYTIPVYNADLRFNGVFIPPELPAIGSRLGGGTVVSISSLKLVMPVKVPQGIAAAPEIIWQGKELEMEPGAGTNALGPEMAGFSVELLGAPYTEEGNTPLSNVDELPFTVSLKFQGSHSLNFLPLGREFVVDLQSVWPHPQFSGSYLPVTREVNDDGFLANWSVSEFSRASAGDSLSSLDWGGQSFSVKLIDPVDIYLQSTRAVKYGILFFLLTFGAFLLFEALKGLRVHPVQYILVGGALTVFYLLLISLSEHVGFDIAYLFASVACVLLLTAYTRSVVKNTATAMGFGALVSLLYGALYVILLSEQYSLALGSTLLFLVLSITMFLTRKVDWYDFDGPGLSRIRGWFRSPPANVESRSDIRR